MLVLDRNQETTAQSVPTGQVVARTTANTLPVKKVKEGQEGRWTTIAAR